MNIELYQALVEIVKTGGPLALWGVGIWLAFTVLKIVVLCLTVYLVVRSVTNALVTIHQQRLNYKQTSISLVSKESIGIFTEALNTFKLDLSKCLKDLESQLKDLKRESKV